MKQIINSIKDDVSSLEPIDLSIRVDDAIMQATPLSCGKWHVVFKKGQELKGVCSATNKQLEEIAQAILGECDDRTFHVTLERDRLGYCIEHSYEAQEVVGRKFKRKRRTDAFRNISFA